MNIRVKFEQPWDVEGGEFGSGVFVPDWALKGRAILNEAIATYNEWQKQGKKAGARACTTCGRTRRRVQLPQSSDRLGPGNSVAHYSTGSDCFQTQRARHQVIQWPV